MRSQPSRFFPAEKILVQCNWSKFWGAGEGGVGAADAPSATQKRLYVPVTRKVDDKIVVFLNSSPRKVSPKNGNFARSVTRKVMLKNEQIGEGS